MGKEPMKTLEDLKKELFRDKPGLEQKYLERKLDYDLISDFIKLRNSLDLTQRELAEKTGIKQPSIARFEKGQVKNVSVTYLNKLTLPLGYKAKIVFEPV